jgi:methionyl-tRNA synthetase
MVRVLVCCAWPYANGLIHVGHMTGSFLPSDIFARYNRLVGNETLMVSGSDMHGAPITVSAEKEGVSPEAIANKFHEANAKTIAEMGISFDLFTHTHTRNHEETVKEVFLSLLEKGHLEKASTPQFHCPSCQRFLPDCRDERARGDQCDSCGMDLNAEELLEPRCQLCEGVPSLRETEHYFLKLSHFTDEILRFVESSAHWKAHVRAFTTNVLKEGLVDRPITRDISWGVPVPVPGFEDKRVYVWFEAVIGYLSASKEWAKIEDAPDDWRKFWEDPECRGYYFLGKDNIVFHTIIWPAIILGHGGLNLPYDVPANQFMMVEGQKFSKSMGVSIDIASMLGRFKPDVIRYYLSANMPEAKDSDFSWDDLAQRVNNELVATYGNFLHRALSFTYKNFGKVPEKGELDERDAAALARVEEASKEVSAALGSCEFRRALKGIMDLAQFGNQYFDSVAPWSLVGTDKARCGTVLHVSLLISKALAVMAWPFMPFSSESVWKQLCMDSTIEATGWRGASMPLNEGRPLEKPSPQFAKVEATSVNEFQRYAALDLKVGKVLDVQQHPNADKLYLMKVDVGRQITIVSGLKEFYTADELKAKTLVIVTNLEPATLRGVKSEGMLLAAEAEGRLALLTPETDLPAGTQVSSGLEVGRKTLSFKEFQKLDMRAGVLDPSSPPMLDIGGRKLQCMVEKGEGGKTYPAFVAGDKAMVLTAADGTRIVLDREIAAGAKIR